MAGHSKWTNIKHRKEHQDAKKGKIFTKLVRELTVAVRHGGSDPCYNPCLRIALDKAFRVNMRRDIIDRAIASAIGSTNTSNMMELSYEGYGPQGVAVIVECITDNRNRTAAAVRHIFSKYGGTLGTDGSVAYLFERKGQITFAPGVSEDALMEAAIKASANDVVINEDNSIVVFVSFTSFYSVYNYLEVSGFKVATAEIVMLSTVSAKVDLDNAQKVLKMLDMLEGLDDVQNVYSNANVSRSAVKQLD
ncbi:YebC/PmpR family DNA-binding transcriptional regulator [Candidatus Pseudomonas adelgestsugas]|uniref:Probable transcriptional regulatory protein C3B55_00916 n=1 Tax=Candidatus Pseudomonas adelgestsugas TaxID=1302376 RepID=A0ABX5R9J7_9PSED|nr:YebC/PmpR family DNA-binding transcriptional regulator [Candidatus Pseudomonas adelgestsugas]QAX82219.1 Transcriptional regulatory protein PmpR [Candidatus Pseudomonas adelgestsugas]